MARKKERKIYGYGDVCTARLTAEAGCTDEVLAWINKDRSESQSQMIIEAIKLRIAIEKKVMGDAALDIRETQIINTAVTRELKELQNVKIISTKVNLPEKVEEPKTDKDEKEDIQEYVSKNIEITKAEVGTTVEDEIYGDEKRKVVSPGIRALNSLRR